MKSKTIIFLILLISIITLTSVVSAYNTNSLQLYYPMNDPTGNKITDVHQNYNLLVYGAYTYTSVTGIKQTALQGTTAAVYARNTTFTNYDNVDITTNFWFKDDNGFPSSSNVRPIDFGGFKVHLSGNTTNIQLIDNDICTINISGLNILTNNFTMFTTVFDKTSVTSKFYVNSINVANCSAYDIPYGSTNFQIYQNELTVLDEMSLWFIQLNQTDIQTLYNNGIGLNYSSTLSNSININTSINTTGTNITIGNTTFMIGINTYSKQQCVNVGNGLDYVCNDTFYNPFDNSFYCDIDNIQSCGIGRICVQNIFDNKTKELFRTNYNNVCSQQINTYTTLNLNCLTNLGWEVVSPLFAYLDGNFGYNCSILEYYPLSTTTYCSDSTLYDITIPRINDSLYINGECTGAGCANFCSPNTYQCGSIKQSQKCVLQTNGCYDWSVNQNCVGSDVCKEDYGCSGLITKNTCNADSDCLISGQYCNSIGECVTGTNPNPTSSIFDNSSNGTKYIIILVLMVLIFVLGVALGSNVGMIKAGFIVSIVINTFVLIIATVFGWIPVVFLIMLIIVAIASMFLFKGSNNSGGA